jgi:hypothetical protein
MSTMSYQWDQEQGFTFAERTVTYFRVPQFLRQGANHYVPKSTSCRKMLSLLLPSFVVSYLGPARLPQQKHKRGIAALDGLRGIACLFVFNEHFTTPFQEEGSGSVILHVPIFRLIWYGRSMVTRNLEYLQLLPLTLNNNRCLYSSSYPATFLVTSR